MTRPRETYSVPLKTVGQYSGTAPSGGIVVDLVAEGQIDSTKLRADTIVIQNRSDTESLEVYLTDDLLSGAHPWTIDGKGIYSFHIEGFMIGLKGVSGDVDFEILVLERL